MKRIIFLILLSFIITGCSANYNLTYEDNTFKESINVLGEKDIIYENNPLSYYINLYYQSNISINYLDDPEQLAEGDNLSSFTFYNKSIVDDSGVYGINLNYDFLDSSSYSNTYIGHILFDKVFINEYYLNANGIKNIFSVYPYLEKITITFSTDKKIKDTNCDEEKNNTYYWYIDKNNYIDKYININFDVEANRNNTYLKDGYFTEAFINYFLLIVIVILLIIILVIYEKIKKSNK